MAAIKSKRPSAAPSPTNVTRRPYGRRITDRQTSTLAQMAQAAGLPVAGSHLAAIQARRLQVPGLLPPALHTPGQQPSQFALPFPGNYNEQPAGRLNPALKQRRRRVGPRPPAAQTPSNDWSDALLAAYAPPTIVLSNELEMHATVGADTTDYLRRKHWHRGERMEVLPAPDLLPHFLRLCGRGRADGSTLVTRPDGTRLRMCLRVQQSSANNSEQRFSYLSFEPDCATPVATASLVAQSPPLRDRQPRDTPPRTALLRTELADSQRAIAYIVGELDDSQTTLERLSMELHGRNAELTLTNAALSELNDDLIARNDELSRAAALLQTSRNDAQLALQAQRIQQAEAVDQLTGGIAHEFNNILASIMGYTDLLARVLHDAAREVGRDTAEPATAQRYVAEVMRASERARSLVQQLLLYGRRSSDSSGGGGSIQSRPTNPARLLDEIVPQLRSVLPAAIEFDVQRGEPLPSTNIDAAHITQALTNIVMNARDAIQSRVSESRAQKFCAGHIELTADAVRLNSQRCASCQRTFSGTYLQLSVRDSGPGVAEGSLAKLFEPFFTSKDVGKGPGLGLSVAHGIVHAHGGHITMHTSGDGATFTLLLPVAADCQARIAITPLTHALRAAATHSH